MSLAHLRAADVHGAAALPAPTRRDISIGELDALCRKHRLTLACGGATWTASRHDGRFERYSVTARTMDEAVLWAVASIEARQALDVPERRS